MAPCGLCCHTQHRFGVGEWPDTRRCTLKAQTVDVRESAGRILCCTIFRQGGRKLLAKGHVLSEDDIRLLENEGLGQVWVTELEDEEIGEDEAVRQVAVETGCGCLEIC